MSSHFPGDQHSADRAVLADFINHPAEECDAAAQRLAQARCPHNRMIGTEWLTLRRQVQR